MGILRVKIREADRVGLTPARVHLWDENGRFYYPEGCIRYERDNHFTVNGSFKMQFPSGKVSILVEKGKEYTPIKSTIDIKRGEEYHVDCELHRWINMAERGWYSGDLHIHRPISDMENLVIAEDLNVAPDITVWNEWNYWDDKEIPEKKSVTVDRTHVYGILSQEDERKGGAVMLMNPDPPVDLGDTSDWYPTNFHYCRVAHEKGVIVDQEKPFWWEAPVNVALGGVDTIGIINNHIQREGIMDNEAWGKPRDKEKYPGYRGFIENVLDLYYRYLNLGMKLSISAGSASGVLKNPVGFNRLYVHMGRRFNYDRWFRAMKAGLSFATNGPMLFFSINRCELGATLMADAGEEFHGEASLNAISCNPLDRAEIIYNGEVIREFSAGGSTELNQDFDISVSESGWITARVFEEGDKTIRFAHTNPIFIEIGSPMKPRCDDAQYYLDWCKELLSASSADKERYANNEQRHEVESLYRRAIRFYENLLDKE